MKENTLADMSVSFSVQVINLVKDLKEKHKSVIEYTTFGRSYTAKKSLLSTDKRDFFE